MFLGLAWMASKHSKTLEGIEIVALVFNDGFWKDAEEIIVVTESLVRVLSTNNFHNHTILPFCHTIILRSVWCCGLPLNASLFAKVMELIGFILGPIISP